MAIKQRNKFKIK